MSVQYRKQAAVWLRTLRKQCRKYGGVHIDWRHVQRGSIASGLYLAATCYKGRQWFETVESEGGEVHNITRRAIR